MKNNSKIQLLQMGVLTAVSLTIIIVLNIVFKTQYPIYLTILFNINVFFIYMEFICSYLYRLRMDKKHQKWDDLDFDARVSVIIPCYNESPDVIKLLFEQLETQTLPPSEVLFIDDCSTSLEVYHMVIEMKKKSSLHISLVRFKENQGKLRAIKYGIEHSLGDYLVFIDADSYILETGIKELVAPLYFDENMGATCGQVRPMNYEVNFLTKMQNSTYFNSYNLGRQYQGFFNKVLVCSGAISAYKKSLVLPHLNQLVETRFSHQTRYTGDDIVLTTIIIRNGYKTAYVDSSLCYTSVPEILKDYFHQQMRWVKDAYFSFFEEFDAIIKKPLFFILQLNEVFFWLIASFILIYFLFTYQIKFDLKIILLITSYSFIITILKNYYSIFILRKNIFSVILYDVAYKLILLSVRICGLLSFFQRQWKLHERQQ